MIAEVRKRGCHTVPYINGRLWDPDSDSYKTLNGASASCRKPDGTLYTEIYPTSQVLNTVTCPASGLWQNIITDLVIKIQKKLKTNGVYIDQIAAAAPQPCWATNHGHACGGGDYWHKSYRHLMDSLRTHHLEPGQHTYKRGKCGMLHRYVRFVAYGQFSSQRLQDCAFVPDGLFRQAHHLGLYLLSYRQSESW